MKRQLTKETATQYVYDYGFEEAAKLLQVTEQKLEELIYDEKVTVWNKPSLNKNAKINNLNPYITNYIEKNYSKLYDEFVKSKEHSIFYQSDEDVFHNALIKVSNDFSKPTEEQLHTAFNKAFRTIKWENRKRNSQMMKKEIPTDFLEFDNDYDYEDDY